MHVHYGTVSHCMCAYVCLCAMPAYQTYRTYSSYVLVSSDTPPCRHHTHIYSYPHMLPTTTHQDKTDLTDNVHNQDIKDFKYESVISRLTDETYSTSNTDSPTNTDITLIHTHTTHTRTYTLMSDLSWSDRVPTACQCDMSVFDLFKRV